jgi:protein subunit release factor A
MRCKGAAIRTYVLDGDRRIVDHRSGTTRRDVWRVLDGDLDAFILAWLRTTITEKQ